jgi:hypothetical protein
MIASRLGLLIAGAAVAFAAGCARAARQTTATPSGSCASSGIADGQEAAAPGTASGAATGTGSDAVPAGEGCGHVTAASGPTLQVLDSASAGIGCPEANRLVGKFQAEIAGKQPARSSEPVSATINGWLCVSGPPSAEGGTTCSLQDTTVFAHVVAAE